VFVVKYVGAAASEPKVKHFGPRAAFVGSTCLKERVTAIATLRNHERKSGCDWAQDVLGGGAISLASSFH